jgi:hypothetical protein
MEKSLGPEYVVGGAFSAAWSYVLEIVASKRNLRHRIVVDGDADKYGNVAGYVNSCFGVVEPSVTQNVEHHLKEGESPLSGRRKYIVVVAIQDIDNGEELFSNYDASGSMR